MESNYYDVIIVGAGIAGCGLAYNLKRIGYKGSILVIDKDEVGANKKTGLRIIAEDKLDAVKEYSLPYFHKFKGFRLGGGKNIIVTINIGTYLLKYIDACVHLIKSSDAVYRDEIAEKISLESNTLQTNKRTCKFKYMVDSSGSSFFLRNQLNLPKPRRYWIGFPALNDDAPKLDKNYYYNYMNEENVELVEFLFDGQKFIKTIWKCCHRNQFELVHTSGKKFVKIKTSKGEVIVNPEDFIAFPIGPTFPLAMKNVAFLGDSFGNAPHLSGAGIDMCLRTSKMLAEAISKDSLKSYEKEWRQKFAKTYLNHLCVRAERTNNPLWLQKIKKYPTVSEVLRGIVGNEEYYLSIIRNNFHLIPSGKIKNVYPGRQKLFLAILYVYYKILYFMKKQ